MVAFRYQYTAEIGVTSGGGFNADGDPIPETKTFNSFQCDIQTQNGREIINEDGDRIAVNFLAIAPPSFEYTSALELNGTIRYRGKEWNILNYQLTRLAVEIWF